MFDFQKQRGVYLNKSFYLEKLRVSYFEKRASISSLIGKNSHPNFIFRYFIKFLHAVSHAGKRAPVSDWWLH